MKTKETSSAFRVKLTCLGHLALISHFPWFLERLAKQLCFSLMLRASGRSNSILIYDLPCGGLGREFSSKQWPPVISNQSLVLCSSICMVHCLISRLHTLIYNMDIRTHFNMIKTQRAKARKDLGPEKELKQQSTCREGLMTCVSPSELTLKSWM